ncbi:M48 family metalloprotease [Caldimonas tepidiphila]|uniref:M48 family metalloprotease n=1 Tax=Caldimonas tepidiphila TaxID=2315841 RepID=UPI000E5A2936|nr:M48 family metalloprotease [Caldimonas tepidiphila]
MRRLLLSLSLSVAVLGGCATVENPVTGEAERTVMDVQTEIAEGRKAHPQILAEYGEYKDPKLQAYVDELGQRLARHSHRSELKWHFTVLDSPEVNAFALPGGYVYVTRGLMAYMESEADLAGVIAHEIGHVTARHGSQRATRQQTAGLGVLAATILGAVLEGRGVSGAADLASQVSQGVAAGYVASYGRGQELQSDQLAAEYLARAGYDPKNMIDVIRVLQDQERYAADLARAQGREPRGDAGSWLASHPSNEQRLDEITEIASRYQGSYAQDEGRARYLRMIDGLPFGESREQGLTRGRNFYHEPLGFALTAPAGWRIRNAPDALLVASPEGSAGLVMRPVPPDAGRSHEEILRKVLQPEQGRTERFSVNGMPATRFVGVRRNAQGAAQPVDATVVTGPGNRPYLFLQAARDRAALQQAAPRLQEALASFRPMSAADRSAARPWTLRTVPYPRGGFEQLARQSALDENALQQLRLLNGVYASGEPRPGQLVKIVQ